MPKKTRIYTHIRAREGICPDEVEMREKQVESWLVESIKKIGGRAYKWTSPGNAGVPDRIVLLPGERIIFVELKTDSGRLTKIQQIQIRRIRELGFRCEVIHGRKEAEEFINEIRTT